MWQSQATTDSGTHTCLVQLIFSLLMTLLPSFVRENTIRDGGSTTLYSANTVYTFHTFQTTLHCLNRSMYACIYILLGKVRLLDWTTKATAMLKTAQKTNSSSMNIK